MSSLPSSQKALILTSFSEPLAVKSVPTPALLPGSAVVRILESPVLSYAASLYSGALQYPLHPPQTVGGGAIGRIAAVANDATTLKVGDLVLVDAMIRGRDEPGQSILLGIHGGNSEGAAKLMKSEECWRDGSCAEFARWPLENIHRLDEEKLVKGKLGYSISDLSYLLRLLVPGGGFGVLDIKPGERIVIAPATGQFGGAAVEIALAMGADVVICGRKANVLEKMKSTLGPVYPTATIDTVALTGDVGKDSASIKACGVIDAFLDFSPSAAASSTHITSCLLSLKHSGRACLMGGIQGNIQIPYALVMFNDLKISGKFMYSREDVRKIITLVEGGRLKFQLPDLKGYGLDKWEDAFKMAEEKGGWREIVVLEPEKK